MCEMTTTEAINFFGSAAALARALKIKAPSISEWGDYPPIGRQYQIQVLTKNKLKATQPDRPDAA